MNIKFTHLYNYTDHIEGDVELSEINNTILDCFNNILYEKHPTSMLKLLSRAYFIKDFNIDMDNNKILFKSSIDKVDGKCPKDDIVKFFKKNSKNFVNTLVNYVWEYARGRMRVN